MGFLDRLNEFSRQMAAGQASDDDIHATYDQVAPQLPQGALADGISHTFRSDQTPPFEQMLSGLFGRSDPNQKAGLLNQILGALGPNAGALLAQTGLGALAGSLGARAGHSRAGRAGFAAGGAGPGAAGRAEGPHGRRSGRGLLRAAPDAGQGSRSRSISAPAQPYVEEVGRWESSGGSSWVSSPVGSPGRSWADPEGARSWTSSSGWSERSSAASSMRLLGFAGEGGMIYTILVATLGAVVLTWLVRKMSAPKTA